MNEVKIKKNENINETKRKKERKKKERKKENTIDQKNKKIKRETEK